MQYKVLDYYFSDHIFKELETIDSIQVSFITGRRAPVEPEVVLSVIVEGIEYELIISGFVSSDQDWEGYIEKMGVENATIDSMAAEGFRFTQIPIFYWRCAGTETEIGRCFFVYSRAEEQAKALLELLSSNQQDDQNPVIIAF